MNFYYEGSVQLYGDFWFEIFLYAIECKKKTRMQAEAIGLVKAKFEPLQQRKCSQS